MITVRGSNWLGRRPEIGGDRYLGELTEVNIRSLVDLFDINILVGAVKANLNFFYLLVGLFLERIRVRDSCYLKISCPRTRNRRSTVYWNVRHHVSPQQNICGTTCTIISETKICERSTACNSTTNFEDYFLTDVVVIRRVRPRGRDVVSRRGSTVSIWKSQGARYSTRNTSVDAVWSIQAWEIRGIRSNVGSIKEGYPHVDGVHVQSLHSGVAELIESYLPVSACNPAGEFLHSDDEGRVFI